MPGFIAKNSVEGIANGLMCSSILLANLIIIVQSYVTRHKQLNIIENIVEIDDIWLKKLQKCLKYTNYRLFNQKVFGILFFMVLMLVISIILMILRNTDYLLIVKSVYPLLLIKIRCIQIIFYVDVVRDRLNTISDIVNHVINCERELAHENTMEIIYLSEEINTGIMENVELVSLKKIYSILWDINCLMDDCFGWSLLLICIQYFVRLTTSCYWLYLIVSREFTNNEQYDALCDIITILSILWLICNGCQKCTQTVCYDDN